MIVEQRNARQWITLRCNYSKGDLTATLYGAAAALIQDLQVVQLNKCSRNLWSVAVHRNTSFTTKTSHARFVLC